MRSVIKDKLRVGLSGELAKEWSRVHPKPDSVNGQMTLLREIGHAIEDHNKLEANRRGRKDRTEPQDRQSNRRSNKNRKGKTFGQKDQEPSKPVSRFERALKGVSKEVRTKRKQEGVCLKCGKSGHGWADCWSKEPNSGEKRKDPSSETGNSAKKLKTSVAAAVQAAREPST
jgi:hypothetical protein